MPPSERGAASGRGSQAGSRRPSVAGSDRGPDDLQQILRQALSDAGPESGAHKRANSADAHGQATQSGELNPFALENAKYLAKKRAPSAGREDPADQRPPWGRGGAGYLCDFLWEPNASF